MTRSVLLCADDFGANADDSAAIVDLAASGRLSAVSCFTEAPPWPSAGAALRAVARPVLLGVHFNLTEHFVGGERRLAAWMARSVLGRIDRRAVRAALERQVEAFVAVVGRPPDYIDGHQHVHLFPGIRSVLYDVLGGLRDRWPIRVRALSPPFGETDAPFKRRVIQALAAGAAREVGADAQLWLNTAFGGDYSLRSQAPFAVLLEQWLTSAPDGGMIMCHPGVTTATQRQELGVLESDRLSTLLQTLSVQLEPPSDRFSSPSTSNRAKDRRSDGR